MGELLRSNLRLYLLAVLFIALWLTLVFRGFIKLTKTLENKKIKTFIRFSICIALTFFFVAFAYFTLFKISLANYEYNNGYTDNVIGVVDSIEIKTKDRTYITIEDKKFTLVCNGDKSIATDIKNGDNVKIQFGKHSNFIFDIEKMQ